MCSDTTDTFYHKPTNKQAFLDLVEVLANSYYPDEDWNFILITLINDEAATDEELIEHFLENGVNSELINVLIENRTNFLVYGLDIPQY